MFENVSALFARYSHGLGKDPKFNRDLAAEVSERLNQLEYLVAHARELEEILTGPIKRIQAEYRGRLEDAKARGIDPQNVPPPQVSAFMTPQIIQRDQRIQFELRLFTEAFYYFAGRIRTIFHNKAFPMPGMTRFDCRGVTIVRNKLLEHSEGRDAQVSMQSFACGGPQGPVLKAMRYTGQEDIFPDKGLYVNAAEFVAELEELLLRELAKGEVRTGR